MSNSLTSTRNDLFLAHKEIRGWVLLSKDVCFVYLLVV